MQKYWWCAIFFRILLPCTIAIAAFMRPTVTSYTYMLVGFYMPFFSVPTPRTMAGSTGAYMKILVVTCMLTCCSVVSFYFALFFPTGQEYEMAPCGTLEMALRTIGLIEYQGMPLKDTIIWILPEPLMLLTAIILYLVFKRLTKETEVSRATAEMEETAKAEEISKKKLLAIFLNFGKYFTVLLFCVAAILKPSLIGLIYYLVFLSVMTFWAFNQSLGKVFARIIICFTPLISLHLTIMFGYQLQYFQDNDSLDPSSTYGRLFQLVIFQSYKDCEDPRLFKLFEQTKSSYALPVALFMLYYICVLVSREILQAKDGLKGLFIAFFQREPAPATKWQKAFKKLQKKMDDDKWTAIDSTSFADRIRGFIERAIQFVIKMSYLVANFTMMIWAIIYVGWKTLFLLIWANLLWLLPARKKIMLATSPFLVVYIWFLLGTSYVYSLDADIPAKFGVIDMASGSHWRELKWVHLLIKSLFSIIIFVTMRQFLQERTLRNGERSLAEVVGVTEAKSVTDFGQYQLKSETWKNIEKTSKKWISLSWIWLVIILLIWMEFWLNSNLLTISFFGLAIVFIMTFQLIPFDYWKKFLWIYWWIVITFAMFNLFVIYMYQMSITHTLMNKYIFSEEVFSKYGFYRTTDVRARFLKLAIPLVFQIAIVIQHYYLQKDFNKLTSPSSPEDLANEEKNLQESGPRWKTVKTTYNSAKNVFFQIMEIHLKKIILFMGWLLCHYDMCAVFVPFVFLLTASCIFGRRFTTFVIYLMSCFVQFFILARLVYMNRYYEDHDKWNYVGYYLRNGKTYNVTLNSAEWLGFYKSKFGNQRAPFWPFAWCFAFIFVVILDRVTAIRQYNYRKARNLPTVRSKVMFPDINYQNCHENTRTMLKFLVNYGFYKFGVEVTAVVCTILMMLRMDIVAIILSISLLISFALSRKYIEIIWMPFLVIVAVSVPWQYIMTLGYWPTYFNESNSRFWNYNDFRVRVQQFCHFMNMAYPPKSEKISFDFILLMCLSRQWRSFRVARQFRGMNFGAGDNDNVANLIDEDDVNNPVPDFVTYTRNYLDIYKKIIFLGWFYLALLATFLAGTMRSTIYSFGYILFAFFFMWEGTDMFLRPPKRIMIRWNILILYNVSIMVFRSISQVFGCILIYEWQNVNCKVYTMFTVGCEDKFGMTHNIPNMNSHKKCVVPNKDLGLGWDCLCFFFLIVQQRIFKSYHFFHIVNEAKCQTILASRGATLIEEQRKKKREAVDAQNAQIKVNIKRKMDRIEANRQKIQGAVYLKRKRNHKHMLRSGDYYMFDDVERSLDVPLVPPEPPYVDTDSDPYDPMNITELIKQFVKSNIPSILEERALRQRQKQAVREGKKPEDFKKALIPRNTKPSTSKEPSMATIATKPSMLRKILNIFLILLAIFESIVVSLTSFLNRLTKEFRTILDEMDKDRRNLKEKTKYTQGDRIGVYKIWQPVKSYWDVFTTSKDQSYQSTNINYSIYAKLLRAIGFLLLSKSEWLCYLVIILNQVIRANFISLPLCLMVFCWGALTIPKPTKTFWVVTIAYVLIMLIIKNFFVMKVADWNEFNFPENPFYPPKVIGIERYVNLFFNLILLSALFFHRVVLQRLGLWEPVQYRTAFLIEDGDYNLKDGKLLPVGKNETPNKNTLNIKSNGVPLGDYFPQSIVHGITKYGEVFRLFIQQLISPSSTQVPMDVYTPMFLCDLMNLLLIVFFYGYFGDVDTEEMGIIGFVINNRVPIAFILIVSCYFFLISLDRWIYLRKNRFAKLVYLYFQVMGIHIWFFVLYPMMTGRVFNQTIVVQFFYVFKCFYFLFSAYQIRSGYPQLISSHYLIHGTSLYHRFAFKLYTIIPYLFELRSLLDWTCTDTTLGVSDWFKMEEITQEIFDQKCQQDFEAQMDGDGGEPKSRTFKYLVGGFLYIVLFLTIIFPFFLFSLGDTVGVPTHPPIMNIEVYIGTSEPIFHSYASAKLLKRLTHDEYANLTGTFNNIKESQTLFVSFDPEDVVVVKWSDHSMSSWGISPGSLQQLIEEVKSNSLLTIRVQISYTHIGSGDAKSERIFGQNCALPNEQKEILLDMLQNGTDKFLWLPLVFPKFLKITKDAKPKVLSLMEEPENYQHVAPDPSDATEDDDDDDLAPSPKRLRNLLLALQKKNDQMWWQVREQCNIEDDNYVYYLKDLVYNKCDNLVMYTFNEKVFSGTLNYITGSGILGLYLIYFMLVFQVIRSMMIGVDEIWIEDIPNSNLLLRKCKEVYVARDMQNFELEEELFSELIFVMRSREVCIKLTRFDDDPYNPTYLTPGSKR